MLQDLDTSKCNETFEKKDVLRRFSPPMSIYNFVNMLLFALEHMFIHWFNMLCSYLSDLAVTEDEINQALDEGDDLHTLPLTPPATQPIKSLLSDLPLHQREVNQPASKPAEILHIDSQLENGDGHGDAEDVVEVAAAETVTQQTVPGDGKGAVMSPDSVATAQQDPPETDCPPDSVNTAAAQGDALCVESSRDKAKEEAVTLSWEETK